MSPLLLLLLSGGLLAAPALALPKSSPPEISGLRRVIWILNIVYCRTWHRLEVRTPCTLPSRGPALLVSNHTCGIDHMLLQACTGRLLGFMIAQEYYDLWWSRPFCKLAGCIPVKRDGRDFGAARVALRVLQEGKVLPIFPEGKINPESGDRLLEAKPGAAFIALKARVPVIPAYIRGTPRTNDIGIASRTPSRAEIRFGKPIAAAELGDPSDRDAAAKATERLMSEINALRLQALAERQGTETVVHGNGDGDSDDDGEGMGDRANPS